MRTLIRVIVLLMMAPVMIPISIMFFVIGYAWNDKDATELAKSFFCIWKLGKPVK